MQDTTATGKQLSTLLSSITAEAMHTGGACGPMASLWELLPDTVAGPQWVGEIVDAASTLSSWLNDDEEYTLETISDLTPQLADSECEDYYSNINRRVQELSLWANSDLDEEVAQLAHNDESQTLTGLNALYLYCAMRGLYYVLAQWVMDRVEELEEVA